MQTVIKTSPSGNRTPVARVTGGNTHHYTKKDRNVASTGIEPATFALLARRSNQLS